MKKIISIFVAVLLLVVLTCCMGCDSTFPLVGDDSNIGAGDNIAGGGANGGNSSGDSGSNGDNTDENIGSGDNNDSDINMIYMTVGSAKFEITLYDGAAADALVRMLPLTLNMSDMAHEKYYYLPTNLPTAAEKLWTIRSGDIMLWGSNCLVLFYETFSSSYSYTRIGRIENTSGLVAAVGSSSNITIKFMS